MSASIQVSTRHRRWLGPGNRVRILRAVQLSIRFSLVLASLLAALALGVYTQLYDGTLAVWVARDLSGTVYALAWCLALATVWPTARPRIVASISVAICFGIEASQLWHPHLLEVARATEIGRLALGSTFLWSDLPYYVVGAVIGSIWLSWLPFRTSRYDVESEDFVRPMGVRP
jgi:hypothetical protein